MESLDSFVFATGNESKLLELLSMLSDLSSKAYTSHKIISKNNEKATFLTSNNTAPPEIEDESMDVDETSTTLVGNAFIKAKAWANLTSLVAISDDSGIFVEALGGKPGVDTAHISSMNDFDYAKLEDQYGKVHHNSLCLLKLLEGEKNRKAEVRTTLCSFFPSTQTSILSTGVLDATVAKNVRTIGGFGFDPIVNVEYQGEIKTLTEMGQQGKNEVSPRSIAFKKLYKKLVL